MFFSKRADNGVWGFVGPNDPLHLLTLAHLEAAVGSGHCVAYVAVPPGFFIGFPRNCQIL